MEGAELNVPAATYLALGNELTTRLLERVGAEPSLQMAHANRATIAAEVTADATQQEVIANWLRGEMLRRGFPTSDESRELLEADARRDELNEATGTETQKMILQQRLNASEAQRDFPRSAKEQAIWERENAAIRHEIHREFGPDAITDFERAARKYNNP